MCAGAEFFRTFTIGGYYTLPAIVADAYGTREAAEAAWRSLRVPLNDCHRAPRGAGIILRVLHHHRVGLQVMSKATGGHHWAKVASSSAVGDRTTNLGYGGVHWGAL